MVHEVNSCCHCGEGIQEQQGEIIHTGQIFDIPYIELKVTEHHKVRKFCPKCNQYTTSDLPVPQYSGIDYIDAQ